MEFQTLKLREDTGVLYLTINNPPINLMNQKMIEELFKLTGYLMQNPHLKVVVIDSADPDFFIAHFDLEELEDSVTNPENASRYPDMNAVQALALSWQALPQVTIAKVDGRVRGGGLEFILGLDMRFASENSLFCSPEARGGFLAAGGGTTRILLAAGPARGLEFLLSTRDFTGSEAEAYNLINRALPKTELDTYVADLAERVAEISPEVVAMHRAVLANAMSPFVEPMFAGLAAENDGFRSALESGALQASAKEQLEAVGQTREAELNLPETMRAVQKSARKA